MKKFGKKNFNKTFNQNKELLFEAKPVEAPILIKEKCNKCNLCVKNCPTYAIKMNPYPEIDPKKCIRCDVCVIFCPKEAFEVKKPIFVD